LSEAIPDPTQSIQTWAAKSYKAPFRCPNRNEHSAPDPYQDPKNKVHCCCLCRHNNDLSHLIREHPRRCLSKFQIARCD
jgi:hypothetical protein